MIMLFDRLVSTSTIRPPVQPKLSYEAFAVAVNEQVRLTIGIRTQSFLDKVDAF